MFDRLYDEEKNTNSSSAKENSILGFSLCLACTLFVGIILGVVGFVSLQNSVSKNSKLFDHASLLRSDVLLTNRVVPYRISRQVNKVYLNVSDVVNGILEINDPTIDEVYLPSLDEFKDFGSQVPIKPGEQWHFTLFNWNPSPLTLSKNNPSEIEFVMGIGEDSPPITGWTVPASPTGFTLRTRINIGPYFHPSNGYSDDWHHVNVEILGVDGPIIKNN